MGIAIILLLLAASSLAVMILTRQWVLEEHGVDLDDDSVELGDLDKFTGRQKLILALLLMPAFVVVIVAVGYVLSTIVSV
jgi:hypothetical protein